MKCPQKRDKLILPIVLTNLMEQSKKKKKYELFYGRSPTITFNKLQL